MRSLTRHGMMRKARLRVGSLKQLEQAFQPVWWISSPTFGMSNWWITCGHSLVYRRIADYIITIIQSDTRCCDAMLGWRIASQQSSHCCNAMRHAKIASQQSRITSLHHQRIWSISAIGLRNVSRVQMFPYHRFVAEIDIST